MKSPLRITTVERMVTETQLEVYMMDDCIFLEPVGGDIACLTRQEARELAGAILAYLEKP